MSAGVAIVTSCALIGAALKLAGPVLLGGRSMPESFSRIIALLAPAILAALVVTQAFADGRHLHVGTRTVGVAAGGLVAWRTESPIAAVVVAAALTALLRAVA